MNLYRAKYWWLLTIVPLILLSLPVNSLGESGSDVIIAAEGITLSVDFGNETTITFNDLNGSTVLEVTSEVFDVQVQWYGPLAYIRGIEGVVAGGQSGWEYWVNGEFASIAVNLYTLSNGNIIEWVYSTAGSSIQSQQDPTLFPGVAFVLVSGIGFMAIVYIQTSRKLTP